MRNVFIIAVVFALTAVAAAQMIPGGGGPMIPPGASGGGPTPPPPTCAGALDLSTGCAQALAYGGLF